MRFYHYTTKKAAQSITNNQLEQVTQEEWNCQMNQPQKWAWFTRQHEEGFYLTTIPPAEISEKKEKLGISKLSEVYVLIFDLPWVVQKKMSKVNDSVNRDDVQLQVKKVGEPDKICAKRIGGNKNQLTNVPFTVHECRWAGPVEGMPSQI
ncbi:hypothetical protein ACNFH8_29205 [Pseudomonas sp. NY15436]|uniref:hypothetical protein n=1 Tax=Pseudomonas sp. NY15436 TaxID=3400359 RepID=UPI003A873EA1